MPFRTPAQVKNLATCVPLYGDAPVAAIDADIQRRLGHLKATLSRGVKRKDVKDIPGVYDLQWPRAKLEIPSSVAPELDTFIVVVFGQQVSLETVEIPDA